jgi:DNA-binding Lrp family transcriptional regulator
LCAYRARPPGAPGNIRAVTHAVVLVRAERSALASLGGRLAELEGVAEVYSVTGEWDLVAILRVPAPEDLARVVTERLASVDGIDRTYTMVAFEAFSRHDLEAMFSIGA